MGDRGDGKKQKLVPVQRRVKSQNYKSRDFTPVFITHLVSLYLYLFETLDVHDLSPVSFQADERSTGI